MPGGQVVWLLNRSAEPLDLGCWQLSSKATGMTMTVEPGLVLPPSGFVKLTPDTNWLGMSDEVTLGDTHGLVVDRTPELQDESYDDQVWYRDPAGSWQFGRTQFEGEGIHGHLTRNVPPSC